MDQYLRTKKNRIFAKKGTSKKCLVRCSREDVHGVMTDLHDKDDGQWVLVESLTPFQGLVFDDGVKYEGMVMNNGSGTYAKEIINLPTLDVFSGFKKTLDGIDFASLSPKTIQMEKMKKIIEDGEMAFSQRFTGVDFGFEDSLDPLLQGIQRISQYKKPVPSFNSMNEHKMEDERTMFIISYSSILGKKESISGSEIILNGMRVMIAELTCPPIDLTEGVAIGIYVSPVEVSTPDKEAE